MFLNSFQAAYQENKSNFMPTEIRKETIREPFKNDLISSRRKS